MSLFKKKSTRELVRGGAAAPPEASPAPPPEAAPEKPRRPRRAPGRGRILLGMLCILFAAVIAFVLLPRLYRAKTELLTGCRPRDGEWHKTYRRAIWELAGKADYLCMEAREDFDYHALFSLIGVRPELTLPYVPDADAIRDTERTLYGADGGAFRSRALRAALRRYGEALDKLKTMLEVRR